MTETSRTILLRLSWFPPDRVIMGQEVRPLCFATWHAMRLMGIRLLEPDGVELDPRDEYAQLMVYVWLHRESPEEISKALWSGTWREVLGSALEQDEEVPMEALQLWRQQREEIVQLLEATAIIVKPRPSQGPDTTPPSVVGPDEMAHQISIVRKATGATEEEALWEMPLYQFRQHYHSEMRWHAHWTVRPGSVDHGNPEDFTGYGSAVLANLQAQAEEAREEGA